MFYFIFPPATQATWQAIARLQDWDAIEGVPMALLLLPPPL